MNPMKGMAVIFTLALGPLAVADVVSINGTLSTTDFLADEDWRPDDPLGTWQFYYDVYDVTSSDGADISIAMTSTDFVIWYSLWDNVVLPNPMWIATRAKRSISVYKAKSFSMTSASDTRIVSE